MYLPTFDWDFTVPQELYGLDPQEGDLTHSMQGAPVIVARGAITGPEGLDERGRSLSAQALSLIRAAIKHGSMHHAFCRSAVAAPEGPPREHLPGPDFQSQLCATSRQDESVLTRGALRKIITAEASRRMPEGPALARALLEAMSPGVSPLTAAEALHDEYGADDLPTVVDMIAHALWAYSRSENLDASEVAALTTVEQELVGVGRSPRGAASQLGIPRSSPDGTAEVGEDPPYSRLEPQARPAATPVSAYTDPGIAHTLWSRLSGEPNAKSTGVPAGAILGGYAANPTQVSPQVRRDACPSLDAYMTGPTPTVRFAGIPADDTRHSGVGPPDDIRQVQVMADIAYGISQQSRAAEEGRHETRGTPSSLTRADEFAVLAARGLDRFEVALCPGEWGRGLHRAIKKAAESSTALFRHLKWPTPISYRMAFAISSFSLGGRGVAHVPPNALSAADFPTVRAEAFDEHVVPTDTKLETRPRAPTVYLQWVRQAENMAHAFALVYGREYREPILRFLRHFQHLHEANDHQYPFSFIADAWEEVFWRETEEIRHAVASLLKAMGGRKPLAKRTSWRPHWSPGATEPDPRYGSPPYGTTKTRRGTSAASSSSAYTSGPCGSGGTTPTRRAWRARHTSRVKRQPPLLLRPQHLARRVRGLRSAAAPAAQLKGYPAGKVLSQAGVGLSRQHAPLDAQGKMKCWDASSHMGCKMTAAQCSRSHEIIRVRGIHWAVRAQLLRRGGVRSVQSSPLTRWTRKWLRCARPLTVKRLRTDSPPKRGRTHRKLGPQNPARSPRRQLPPPAPAEPWSRARLTPPTWELPPPPGTPQGSTSLLIAPLWRKHSDSGFWVRTRLGVRTITRVKSMLRAPSRLTLWQRSGRRHSMLLPPLPKARPSLLSPIDFARTCIRGWRKLASATKR